VCESTPALLRPVGDREVTLPEVATVPTRPEETAQRSPSTLARVLARNKIARGGFTAVFFLQCMEAIGVHSLQLEGD
jgi:hypothetical protein